MNVNQVYGIVNSIVSQMNGTNALAVTDFTGLVSTGKAIISSDTAKDNFLGVLADRIGKTVVRTLDMSAEFPKLLMDDFEFGAILQKINVRLMPAKRNTSWDVGANNYKPDQFAVNKPSVSQTFFTDADAWSYDVTIPDTLLKTAFTSAEAMASFLTGIMDALEKSMTEGINAMSHVCITNFIGEKIHAGNGVVNMLAEYKTKTGDNTLTATTCKYNDRFLKFSSMLIDNYIGYLEKPKTIFNTAGEKRATFRDNMHVMLLNDFVNASKVFMSASTWHKDLVALPNYVGVDCWMACADGTDGVVDANDAINITTSSGDNVEQSGIVGILADRQAIAVGLSDKYTATDRNNHDRYTNYTSGATMQYINDLSENGVVFIIADTE